MNVFITGGTGWIGSAVVDHLIDTGHQVTGLARSDASAAVLEQKGARVRRGDLDDLDGIRAGTADADAVIHLANKHDWGNPAASNKAERDAVETIADTLVGSNRPFVLAAGLSGVVQTVRGRDRRLAAVGGFSPRGAENLALEYVRKGVRVISARFASSTHGGGDHGFVSQLVAAARKHGVSAYIGDGANAWSAAHRFDAARVVRLGLEGAPSGTRLHVVAEEAVTTREIAEAIGEYLRLPVVSIKSEEAGEHFGFVARFFGLDMSASSARTRELLDWTPSGPTLIEDILAGAYA